MKGAIAFFTRKASTVQTVDRTETLKELFDCVDTYIQDSYRQDDPSYISSRESASLLKSFVGAKFKDVEGLSNLEGMFNPNFIINCISSGDINVQNDAFRMFQNYFVLTDLIGVKTSSQTTHVRQRSLAEIKASALNLTRKPDVVRYSYIVAFLNGLVSQLTQLGATQYVKSEMHQIVCETAKVKSEMKTQVV